MMEGITMEESKEAIAKELTYRVSKNTGREDIQLKQIMKINDTKLHALIVGEAKEKPVPSVHIDKFIKYVAGGGDMETAISKISEQIKIAESFTEKQESTRKELNDIFSDKMELFKRSFCQVVDPKLNQEYLENTVHFRMDYGLCPDMELIVRTELDKDSSTILHPGIIKKFQINELSLKTIAYSNTCAKRIAVMNLSQVVGQEPDTGFKVVSAGTYGATAMCCNPDVFEKMADEMNGDLYIIPSSTNEVLVRKNDGTLDEDDLRYMVRDVNSTEVDRTEWLSNDIFLYHRNERVIRRL